jgi:pimeloyl-ACP methyl ester carboxylesterase
MVNIEEENMVNKRFVQVFNNHKHKIHIISNDEKNPILLVLHGGPGQPNRHNIVTYHKELLDHFSLVLYDQRGSGGSYFGTNKKDLTLKNLIEDAYQIGKYSLEYFKQNKLCILAGSFGTEIGILLVKAHPEIIKAYVGFGQVANGYKNEDVSYEFALRNANKEEKEKLEQIGKPVKGCYNPILKGLQYERNIISKYTHSSVIKGNGSYLKTLMNKEYSLRDKIGYIKGAYFSINAFWKNAVKYDFNTQAKDLKAPIYFFQGVHDYVVPSSLTEEYFKNLTSPHKELIWFENSAHNPLNQEKELFHKLLIEKLLGDN